MRFSWPASSTRLHSSIRESNLASMAAPGMWTGATLKSPPEPNSRSVAAGRAALLRGVATFRGRNSRADALPVTPGAQSGLGMRGPARGSATGSKPGPTLRLSSSFSIGRGVCALAEAAPAAGTRALAFGAGGSFSGLCRTGAA